MFGDKQYSSRPYKYPTPESVPEDTGCRTFQIPSDPAWFALFMGALYPLTLPESFQQNEGGLSVETTAEIFQNLIELTYANAENGCVFCTQPGGEPIVRLDEDGYFQQLVDSEWLPPEGEYEIPPVPPREETTDDEKRCLASANATNVMKVLYETLADDYAAGLTLAEAIAHFIAIATALILLPGGLIAAAIALALVIFRIMFETAEFVTADYWTTAFDEKFQCALYECSSVDGSGVVTFDYICFQEHLSRRIDALGDPFEVVLWGQIQAMLSFLGVDGLNLAGGTTAITSAECECEWCRVYDFSVDGWGFAFDPVIGTGTTAVYTGGVGWTYGDFNMPPPAGRGTYIRKQFGTTLTITDAVMEYFGTTPLTTATIALTNGSYGTLAIVNEAATPTSSPIAWSGGQAAQGIRLQVGNLVNGTPAGTSGIVRLTLRGTGNPPDDGEICF